MATSWTQCATLFPLLRQSHYDYASEAFFGDVTGPTLEPVAAGNESDSLANELGGPASGLSPAKFPFYQTFNYSPYECVLV